uniref:Uncharacterized protein n=1 Tax=Amphimedon queenslandica TaxID=400682 RepID=A0A1X7UXZ9_AMPQE
SSEPFILAFDTSQLYPNITTTTATQSSPTITTDIVVMWSTSTVILLMICLISSACFIIIYMRKARSISLQQQRVLTASNEAYQFNSLMINNNPAYEDIGRSRAEAFINNEPTYDEIAKS